ncbi:hypothetical protein I7Z51_002372 [Vibrio parahaemolyticus]|uniref:hypothetical protein n=1 Tax=unclassified Vibrio TaxID=2614977 RepID=UPI001A8CCC01|nr:MULTISPECIES: hypothetical protein [unclassified Vibrio]EGQ7973450.1 hypothetical protein [Vibrio parahaemolyticus]MBO0208648.1 hypothetical protein [Vibrio sp. Vb0877]MDW2322698.1 hypothetical protein [Vibrio sp. 1159]
MDTVDYEQEVMNDPSTSYWLREQIEKSKERDILDVLDDTESLVLILKARLNAMTLKHTNK